jgi:ATP:ADP antiporter, AAA family
VNDAARPRDDRSWLERFLGLFADVRAGEGVAVLLLALNVFVLLFAYYLIKTVREALVLTEVGAANKVYLSVVVAGALALYAKAFGGLARRWNRIRLITSVTLFFASHLVVFHVLGRLGVPLGVVFFVWVGIFNVSIIAQFWSLANDVCAREQGERVFAIVAAGSTLGAVAGSYGAAVFFDGLGAFNLMLATAALLVASLGLTWAVHRRHLGGPIGGDDGEGRGEGRPAEQAVGGRAGAFQLVFRSRYLLLVGAITLFGTWINTTGEFVMDRVLLEAAGDAVQGDEARRAFIGHWKGLFYTWVNVTVVVTQLLIVSRVLKYLGVRVALFILPIVAMGGYTAMMIAPTLLVIFVAKVAENGADYSLQNTVRQALFLVTSRPTKYKAKALIDTVFFRLGDVMAGGLVLIGSQLAFATRTYVAVVMGLVAIWIGLAAWTAREHGRRASRPADAGGPAFATRSPEAQAP